MDWAVELSQDNAHEKKIWVTILGCPDFFLMHVVLSTHCQTSEPCVMPYSMDRYRTVRATIPHNFTAAVDILRLNMCCRRELYRPFPPLAIIDEALLCHLQGGDAWLLRHLQWWPRCFSGALQPLLWMQCSIWIILCQQQEIICQWSCWVEAWCKIDKK